MNRHRTTHLSYAQVFCVLLCGFGFHAQAMPSDPGWPRHYSNGTAELVVYPPQVDSWSHFQALAGRCAFALTTVRGSEAVYGTLRFTAETLVDADQKVVLLRNVRAFDMRFPSTATGTAAQWSALTAQLLPSDALVVSLDRLLAFVHAADVPHEEARVLTEPPPIFISMQPAVLVMIDGNPVMADVQNSGFRRIVNTNWDLFQDRRTSLFYLRVEKAWLSAADLHGAYVPAADVPSELSRLVTDLETPPANSLTNPPATATVVPRVIVTNRPSELIVIQGSPKLSLIAGTQLSSVTNTDSDLFFHAGTRSYYFLTTGRWFRMSPPQNAWQYATATLPDDFKKIPPDHPRAAVLAAVPGTREAEDAVLLAAIPRTAEINRHEAKAEVQYVGAPQFVEIPGTVITYAKNTQNDVLEIAGSYYLCFQGVWFVSTAPQGPWVVADKIPREIYSIPESSPKYHVTYVRIYQSTPTTVVVGYTSGYYGSFVSSGVVVWGTGYYYPSYVAVGVAPVPVYWGTSYYTYGASARYNPATGIYSRGSTVYGPNGGYGAAAAYNPRTGTYAQGAAAWGPNGGAAAGRTYNPSTGTYSAGYHAANPYGSWGEGVVGNGSNWVHGGYHSGSRGTVVAGETSKGGEGVAVATANGKNGYVGKSASGDIYAGANGNVYKRDNGQWYQNQNGSWNSVDRGQLSAQRQQAEARDLGNRNSQMSERSRGNSGAANHSRNFEQRPRFQGRRR